MRTAPAYHPSPVKESVHQSFHVVEALPELQRVPASPGIRSSLIYVDYNSRPTVARQVSRLNWFSDFSLSLSDGVVLACCVCLVTILACLFLLPRL